MLIQVRDGNVGQALRVLTKKLVRDGWRHEIARHRYATTRGEMRRLKRAAAVRRQRRDAKKRAALA